MKLFAIVLCCACLFSGCAKNKSSGPESKTVQTDAKAKKKRPEKPKRPEDSKPIITPDDSPDGNIVSVNNNARFVVIYFPHGNVPPAGRKLGVYRKELKVAELRVTGPQRDLNTVADILTGEVLVKDTVREE